MPQPAEQPEPAADLGAEPPSPDAAGIMQVKVWLLGISPMVWRRMLVPGTCALRGLHGAIQVAMGWEVIHRYQPCLRSRRRAHLLLQTRTLDGTPRPLFERWHPGLANDDPAAAGRVNAA